MNLIKLAKDIKNSEKTSSVLVYARKNNIKIKLLLLVAICSVMIIRGIMQQPQILANKAEIERLEAEKQYELDRQDEIKEMTEMIETDEYIEKIAREKLGLIKKNEKIFLDVSKSDN